jgi:hypothetical protein
MAEPTKAQRRGLREEHALGPAAGQGAPLPKIRRARESQSILAKKRGDFQVGSYFSLIQFLQGPQVPSSACPY